MRVCDFLWRVGCEAVSAFTRRVGDKSGEILEL